MRRTRRTSLVRRREEWPDEEEGEEEEGSGLPWCTLGQTHLGGIAGGEERRKQRRRRRKRRRRRRVPFLPRCMLGQAHIAGIAGGGGGGEAGEGSWFAPVHFGANPHCANCQRRRSSRRRRTRVPGLPQCTLRQTHIAGIAGEGEGGEAGGEEQEEGSQFVPVSFGANPH